MCIKTDGKFADSTMVDLVKQGSGYLYQKIAGVDEIAQLGVITH